MPDRRLRSHRLSPRQPAPRRLSPLQPGPRRLVAVALLALVTAYAVAWPALAPTGWAGSDYLRAGLAPGWPHLMGADSLGHDLSVRVAQALQVSLAVAAGSALAATAIGVAVGAAAAAGGPRLDGLLMRVTDAVAAVPHLLATVVVVALFRGSVTALVLALALTHWPTVARVVRAETQKVMASGYVAASRVAGASPAQVVRHHVLPAVAGQAGLAVVVMVPHAVWHESTLSFLGVGLPPERASLGTLIALARADLLLGRWWALVFPAAALIVVTVAAALLAPARRPTVRPHTAQGRGRRAGPAPAPVSDVQNDYDDNARPLPDLPQSPGAPELPFPAALDIRELTVAFPGPDGRPVTVVDHVSLSVLPGEVLALVGESGAGKSTLADACCGLLPRTAQVGGLVALPTGGPVGHVPQSTAGAFTPTRHVRGQLEEVLSAGRPRAVRTASELCLEELCLEELCMEELCVEVGLDPALADRYPHQLSGGQRRRAAIAAALATGPAVLVADEPTAGLDPQTALAILRLLRRLADERGLAVVLISHDLDALAEARVDDRRAHLAAGRLRGIEPATADRVPDLEAAR